MIHPAHVAKLDKDEIRKSHSAIMQNEIHPKLRSNFSPTGLSGVRVVNFDYMIDTQPAIF